LDEYGEGGFTSRIGSVISKENLQRIGDTVSKENLQKMGNDLVECVRRYPVSSLLIGLGIGYLLARRSDRYRH
jgi:hypothetical protein